MLRVTGRPTPSFRDILTPGALDFVGKLEAEFGTRRRKLLARRAARQRELDAGGRLDFLPETREIRAGDWKIAPVPADLADRRVEITGPVTRKMVINALNSGARVYMADFEDSHSPTWEGTLEGQVNLRDAVRGTISFTSPEGREYRLRENPAVLFVRPRGWHLNEKHVLLGEEEISGAIFDFGLFLFHNAGPLMKKGAGPYFYLPKLESHLEARLWNDIFVRAQELLGIARGTIKATVLIETIPAAFEMNEILYELREHSAGLNCGRWDYIFSLIKRLRRHPDFLLPDRAQVTMTVPCMRHYSLLAIETCHRRGAHAMGGMAAQIPNRTDPAANDEALARVRADKTREAGDGHDGTWVAHPGLVAVARGEFDRAMPEPNQIGRRPEGVSVTAADLLAVPEGTITEEGVRTNVRVGVRYLEAWLRGTGCVPLYGLMEDAATAEISRTQLWQWIHHPRGILSDGRPVTARLFRSILDDEMRRIEAALGTGVFRSGRFDLARQLLEEIVLNDELEEFLTVRAYAHID